MTDIPPFFPHIEILFNIRTLLLSISLSLLNLTTKTYFFNKGEKRVSILTDTLLMMITTININLFVYESLKSSIQVLVDRSFTNLDKKIIIIVIKFDVSCLSPRTSYHHSFRYPFSTFQQKRSIGSDRLLL